MEPFDLTDFLSGNNTDAKRNDREDAPTPHGTRADSQHENARGGEFDLTSFLSGGSADKQSTGHGEAATQEQPSGDGFDLTGFLSKDRKWEEGDGGAATLPDGQANQWGGNLRNEGRKVLFRRDKDGKVNGYSTTTSMVAFDTADGSYVAIPTTIDGRGYSREDAVRHYRETGEHWGRAKSEEEANKIADDVHNVHMKDNQKKWNDYIHEHWDEISDEIRNDPAVAEEHKRRTIAAEDYGVLDRQRDSVVAETGDSRTTRGDALLANLTPGALNEMKKERDFQLSNLERLRSGSAMKEIEELRREGKVGAKEKHRNDGRLRHGVAGALSDVGAGGVAETQEGIDMLREAGNGSAWEGFKKGLSEIFGGEKPPAPTDEEREQSYFDKIESIARNAGIDEKRIGELRNGSKTVEDFAEGLRGEAVSSLTDVAKTRKEAAGRLQKFKADTTDTILNGLITNSGYTGGYILASALGPMGYAALIGDSADQRIKELRQADYDVDENGDLVVIRNEESVGSAIAKGLAGAAVEVGVEVALEKGLGWVFGGIKVPVGKGQGKMLAPWLGKATQSVSKGVARPFNALGRAMSKNPAGKWLVGAAKGFGRYSEITGVHGIPMEMLEEHVQSFADDVLGLDKKSRNYNGLGAETSEWWNKKFWNYEANRDLFLGLVGTMAVQGAYAGTKAHHDMKQWRKNPSGFLKTMIDPKTVDKLSDAEVDYLYKFVSSPRFTKERVNNFLRGVKEQTDLANALLQLKEANTPFFESGQKAVDEAIASGTVKSQFVPPTRESELGPGQQIDWQPHVMNDGRRTMRVYDPNTGIAIDQIGGQNNRLVVTNRDGMRIEVGADESGDAFQKAMNVADRMSIHNQLLDMKRPMKQAYVENRIEALFPKGDFHLYANNAELVEEHPEVAKTRDYNPGNPALTLPDGSVAIVLDNLKDAREANRMILHEAAIHSGLKKKFTTEEKRKFLRNIDDPLVNGFKERLMKLRGVDSVEDLSDTDIEEAFAHMWDRRRTDPSLTQKVMHGLREMGRAVGLPISYNTTDLEVMVDTLQREGQGGRGAVEKPKLDTTDHTKGVPYNEAQRDFSGDVADVSEPSEETPEMAAVRQMQRIDRIKQNHPRMWEYAMRVNGGDEDAAADFIANALEEEGKRGVAGEAEKGFSALEAAAKLENGEDLTPVDLEILDEHGFTGPVLYTDYGYRKQKNGTWRHVGTTNKQEKPNETRNGADEAQAQPAEGAERPAEPETPRPAETGEAPAQSAGVVEKPAELSEAKPESAPPADERTLVDRLSQNGGVLGETPMAELAYDETLKPNFKEGANPETGEVSPIGKPIRAMMPPIVVYEFDKPRVGKDGKPVKKIVGTGVHRYQAAKRAGWESIPTVTLREADGFSIDDIMNIDAISNILDEKGSVNDYIKFLNSTKPTREEAESSGLLDRPKGKTAFLIYESATDDTRAATDFEGSGESGKITPEQAGIIADAAPKQAALQRILVRRALDGVRGKKLAILARSLAEEAKNRKNAPKVESGTQLDLFTSEEDVALLQQEEKRADYRAKKANDYNRIAENLRTALRKDGRLDLNKDYAKELGITDPKDRKQIAAARDKAVERANYWENAIQLDPADKAAMDAELGIESAKPGLQLESPTAEQLAEEERKRREKEAIKNGQEKPIKGSGAVNVQPEMDLGQTGQQDLFSPIVPNEGNAQKPAENVATGAPQKAEATTPTKAEKPMEGRKSGDTGAPNGSATPENSIFGNDKESEQAFTDALDAMWFSRELEDGADDDFEFVNVSKAPFNNVDAAVAWAKSNGIVGKMTDEETGGKGDISISETSIREMLNPAQVEKSASRDAHFAVITKLRNVIAASHIEEVHPDYKKGKDGKRSPANGINPGVTIVVAYAAVDFGGTPMRAKITLKKFADKNTLPKAYAYHVAQIEVLTGNLVHPRKNGTAPRANTSIRRDILLKGVTDVNGVPLLDPKWFSRELEEHTDEEREAHNLLMGVKAIRAFAKSGGKAFGDFAATVKAYRPAVYERIKAFMPGMWLNARLGGLKDLQERTEAQYQAALDLVDQGYTYDRNTGSMKKPAAAPAPTAEKPTAEKPVAEKPTTKEPETPKHKTRGGAIAAAADEIAELIGKGEKFTRQDVEKVVGKHLGGSVAEGAFEMKDVTDILELAVNRFVKGKSLYSPSTNVSAEAAMRVIQRIRDNILAVIPTQTTRSAKQEKMQQFSTVPHEAFVAAWVANITDNDVMLEPSAGIGGIAVFAKNAGANVILNELDPGRRDILEQLGLSQKVYGVNAEYLWPQFYGPVKKGEVNRPTVVVMNPPFSNSALTSKKDTVGVGGKHIEQALEMLAPGGRLVAIVGHGMAHDAESQKVKAWWKKIGEKYRVRADVTVNGEEYAKYGTTYDNDIIVIDKVAPDSQTKPVYGKIQSIDELPAMLEGVRNDRPTIQSEEVAAKPNSGSPSKGTSRGTNAGQRPDDGRNGVQPGNGGHGKAEPHGGRGQPAGRSNGGVSGSGKDDGRESGAEPVRGVGGPITGGLTTVNATSGAAANDNTPQEVGDGTFSTYKPAKVKIDGAKPHPTALVESTAMASVLPPDPTYSPILPEKAIKSGMPSDAQLEQIVYAGQAHEQMLPNGQRRGYFFGDGTGLGKGTEIGGVISDNWNHGRRKAVWVSKESGLMRDAMRDLVTYGLDGQIFDFNPKKKSVTSRGTGIAFLSYDGLSNNCVFDTQGNVRSAKQGQKNRFQHLVEWLGKDFDGVIVFDEAHKAGNAVARKGKRGNVKPAARALAVVALQEALPNARILYVSATGATEVSNLSYATRLGLWGKGTAFRDREDFINRVSAGGLSVMEIVARDMKSMGAYMARSLSYDGIVNRKLEHTLSPDQKRKYDEMAEAWQMVITSVGNALIQTGGAGNSRAVSTARGALWNGEQRFFNQMLTAMQMPSIIADAKKQLEVGNSVVFQLVNTNEATQKRAVEEQRQRDGEVNAEELDLSPRDIIIGYVRNSFPVAQYVEQEDEDGNTQWVLLTDSEGKPVENPIAVEERDRLLERLNMMKLDDNPLELIIDEFGAENVAEVTGRSRRRQMVRNDDGEMEMKLVSRSKKVGLIETDEFNAGKRRVLVFSDAGGTGRSFHADKRFGNQQKRIHYLVQAGWRADAALQGFGRTHRSNEVLPPEYVLCSTDIRGHKRFISTIARRLAQLGSLTAGDRSSAGSGVFSEEDNLENQYAVNALNDLFRGIFTSDRGRFNEICRQLGFVMPKMNRRTGDVEYINQLIDKDGDLDLTNLDIPRFLNRILNMKVDTQNALFDEFIGVMQDHIEAAKEAGTFDPGLEKLQGDKIEELNRTELWSGGKGTGSTDIVEVGVSKKSRKVDFETVLERMKRSADGRNWFFARNLNSGKIFGFAEMSRAKTLQSGAVVNQLRCFSPDGKAPPVLETDVRFDGPRMNFVRVSEKDAAGLWGNALAEIPDLDTTKRFFVHGTMLPIWDRLAVQNPRIFRIAPEGKGAFLGMEVKAENVNDLLRRFGKAAASVELTPEAVLNRIIKDGKKVPLLQDGWELKRSRVNGDYRIELVGPEERRLLEDLARDGLGTMERIGYVPRFFIPRTAEGLKKFLDAYPAMPEDGGIGTVTNAGVDYSALSYEDRQRTFTDLLQKYMDAFSGSSSEAISQSADALDGIIAAMPTEELMRIVEDYQQYDSSRTSPIHHMRTMVRKELQNRGAITDSQVSNLGLWFSRDLEELENDYLSSVAIHEVNAWRRARGLPTFSKPKKPTTSVDAIIKAGKYMASNADEMERFLKVSAETPHNWTAVEVSAVAQRRLVLEQDYDEKTRLINVAEMNGNREEAQHIREARDLVQEQIDVMDRAINKAKREWGLSGLARRFMLNRDGTFARFSGELQSIVGRKLTEAEEQGAQALWNAYREAQGKLDDETIAKTAELLKDIVRKHLAREEQQHRTGKGRPLSVIEKEYQQALDHILVHANRAGGVLMGLPDGRKWIDAIRRYHMAAAIETGRHLDVNEMLEKIHADIDGMVKADDHDIMQMITGHGNTYEADNSELEKALREQRRLMNEYQKWEDMLSEGHLPDKTGIIRDEPTQKEREVQRTTRELMREFMQAHPELLQMDASKRLKTIQDSLMKRWKNEIEDLQKAVANDERIIRQKNTMTYTPEMVERRRQLEEWRQRYREAFPPEPLTHEQKVARILRALQGRLAKLEEKKAALEGAATDADRESVLAKRKTEEVKDPQLDAIRKQIADIQAEIQDLHDINFPEGTTEEFQAMLKTRRTALERNIQRIQTLLLNRDFSPQKREPSALAKRVAADPEIMELTKTRNAAAKRLMQERERYRRSTRPFAKARDWIEVLAASPRIFRTMLDLSATFTQGAALFAGHPKLGLQALKDSIRSLYSEQNTDEIMAAMVADPEFQDYIDAGGHVYYVSDVTEKGVPEEFRGVSQKLRAFGKEFSLEDAHIPFMSIFTKDGTTPDWAYVVKGSERSFGTFLNSIGFSVFKAIKNSGGWGPTGPTRSQLKDLALSINVALGRGYESKGAKGFWDTMSSFAFWAPRFWISGAKMAIGWNVWRPLISGDTVEFTMAERKMAAKNAAKEWVRQMTGMLAFNLLVTLLMGRKDPEWLSEFFDPRSTHFMAARIGNSNVSFFGAARQWITFMARLAFGEKRSIDGTVKKVDRGSVTWNFLRSKSSPLFGLGWDLLSQKTFIGEKLKWDGSAKGDKEKGGWWHVAESLGVPLSVNDTIDVWKKNSMANALMITPFAVTGALKNTYELNEYDRAVNPYKVAVREMKNAWKEKRSEDAKRIRAENPELGQMARIDSLIKTVDFTRKWINDIEKAGKTPSDDLMRKFRFQQQAVIDAIREARKQ